MKKDNINLILAGVGVLVALIMLPKGEKGDGSESGGFQLPTIFPTGTGAGEAAPAGATNYNISFPDFPGFPTGETKKESGINTGYSATASGSVYQAQTKVDPVLANIFKAQTPTQIQTIQEKASSSGRYFAPVPYVSTTKKQDTAASVSKKSGAPVIKTQFSSVRAW